MSKLFNTIAHILAVTLGAYGISALVTVALSLVVGRMGMGKGEAVIAATLCSFAIFAIAAMAAFHARSVGRAWGWLALFSTPAGGLVVLLYGALS